jgi:hypothetical protein
MTRRTTSSPSSAGLGTLAGVFTPEWDGARIRLFSEADPWSYIREEARLEQALAAFRIDAETELMA